MDTEPADGNVWKMLHGAINQLFDEVNEVQAGPAGNSLPSNSPLKGPGARNTGWSGSDGAEIGG